MVVFENEAFALRAWRTSDAVSLAVNANDRDLWNNVRDFFPHPYTEQDARVFIASVSEKRPPLELAIVVDGQAVGGIGFVPGRDVERFSAEIGYWLGASYRGRGIMTAAVTQAAWWLFENTEIVRIFAAAYAANPASQRVMAKAGFRYVGVLRSAYFKNGEFIDGCLYELIKE
ncbi:GNAT family protein [uncultured Alistipes sp.]|uniref:GNAT family N-acetyltransferase n=1 Tax=uncultured Alistipes sp. TaxID=538949 RepID=UPI0025DE2C46|nr:GNAT family protein [uncultured Alistipes sp.]